jgi:hypothetical protein
VFSTGQGEAAGNTLGLTQINVPTLALRFHLLDMPEFGKKNMMLANRIGLIGLSALILTATAPLAQNTGASLLSGNTVNPVLSGQNTLLSARSELSVSPSTPSGLLSNTSGTNPLTGLPCTGPGSLSISGAGTLPGSTSPAVNGDAVGTANGTTSQIPAFPSVFQPGGTGGAC